MAEGRETEQKERTMNKILLIVNCIILATGITGGPLVMRLYFRRGGHRVWLSSFLQTAGFPIMLIPITLAYINRRSRSETIKPKLISMKFPLFALSAFIGILTALGDYLYAYGMARLPVSTSSLILATQLAFTAFFAYILVSQRFTAYSINAVVLQTVAAGVLAMHTSGDRPKGVSTREYVMGFVMTVIAAVLSGFVSPLVELIYKKTKQSITYYLVMEFQFVLCFFATLFCTIGMIINNDFKVIPREARDFKHGETNYYVVIVGSAIMWQAFFLGAMGVIFCGSSLLSGIIIAVFLPVTEVLAVIIYKEKFQAKKGVSLLLSLWGFLSYFYGEIKQSKKIKKDQIPESLRTSDP